MSNRDDTVCKIEQLELYIIENATHMTIEQLQECYEILEYYKEHLKEL